MQLNTLTAISPVDGRYRAATASLSPYFSEFGLIRYRVLVEVEYFIALANLKVRGLDDFPVEKLDSLREIYREFSLQDAEQIKSLEKTTNHDVKAVEYFLKEKWDVRGLSPWREFVHFGLTSQDINNTAIPLSMKEATEQLVIPQIESVIGLLSDLAKTWKDIPLLARTHGQPASPTRLGKELMVFIERLIRQLVEFQSITYSAKFGGATGNFNAHYVAYPQVDWKQFADTFVQETLGLERSQYTTQIEHYDNLAAYFDVMKRINTILTDFSRDIWSYISLDYFTQKLKPGEVGSSAMPHKVNPIDFENAEGNLGLSSALCEFLSAKLPVSRLQRDLTDSTVLRNIGVPIAHHYLALKSIQKGIDKLVLNLPALEKDLSENQAVVAEGIQTILRRERYPEPYEKLKELTRGKSKITREELLVFIDSLEVSDRVKEELRNISPFSYTGI